MTRNESEVAGAVTRREDAGQNFKILRKIANFHLKEKRISVKSSLAIGRVAEVASLGRGAARPYLCAGRLPVLLAEVVVEDTVVFCDPSSSSGMR